MSISRLCDWGFVRKRIKFSTPSLVLRIVSIIVNHNKVESVPSTLNQWANICSDVTPRHWLYRHLLIVSFHLSYLLCCALIVSVHKTLIENVLQIAFNKRVIIIVPFCVFLSHFRGVPTWMVKGHTCKTSLLRFIVISIQSISTFSIFTIQIKFMFILLNKHREWWKCTQREMWSISFVKFGPLNDEQLTVG